LSPEASAILTDAGGGTAPDAPPTPSECDLDGGCATQCSGIPSTTCGIVSSNGLLCELQGFVGASNQVACGQRSVIGTACCGACGCVAVEVFFDGTNCWQGVPTCTASSDQLFNPHAPGAPDGGWTSAANNGVAGQFTLGVPAPDAGAGTLDASDTDAGAGGEDDAAAFIDSGASTDTPDAGAATVTDPNAAADADADAATDSEATTGG
jgi:hypothetical protein